MSDVLDRTSLRPEYYRGTSALTAYPPIANEFDQAHGEIGFRETSDFRPWQQIVLERLRELSTLPDNWDHRGSARVSSDVLQFTFGMLCQIMPYRCPPPSIVPLGDGGLQLIWGSLVGELEVEISRPNEVIAFFLDCSTGRETEWLARADLSGIANILWRYFTD